MGAMHVAEIIGGVLIILISILVVFMVLFQESPKGSGVSALTGGDSYYNKNQANSKEARLARFTKGLTIAFFVLAVLASVLPRIIK